MSPLETSSEPDYSAQFRDLKPTDITLEYIARQEANGWRLEGTRNTDDMSSLAYHEALEERYGKENVLHYQQSALRGSEEIGVSLYFVKE